MPTTPCNGLPIAPHRVTRAMDCQRCECWRTSGPKREEAPADARMVNGRVDCSRRVPAKG